MKNHQNPSENPTKTKHTNNKTEYTNNKNWVISSPVLVFRGLGGIMVGYP